VNWVIAITVVGLIIAGLAWFVFVIRDNERNRIRKETENESKEISGNAEAIHEEMDSADERTVNKWL